VLKTCIFCTGADQPDKLFETDRFYAVPDRYPLVPGHVLVISKAHLRCHAQIPPEWEEDLEAAAARVRGFLRAAYREPVLTWENGVAGQTVFHAHLHLLPLPAERFPDELGEPNGILKAAGWAAVRQHFAVHGGYRYMELATDRRIMPGHAPVPAAVRDWLAAVAGLQRAGDDWVRTTTPEDVREVARRWADWHGAGEARRGTPSDPAGRAGKVPRRMPEGCPPC
jgi:diadenosine tetraphosphate (Ap4A) HIT family hydrolase